MAYIYVYIYYTIIVIILYPTTVLLYFTGKAWPVAMGGGFGIGFALSNCQHEFKRVESLYLKPKSQEVS